MLAAPLASLFYCDPISFALLATNGSLLIQCSIQVLKERILGPDSSFQYYIDNLPMGVPGIPLFFSPDAIRALEQYPPLRCSLTAACCIKHHMPHVLQARTTKWGSTIVRLLSQ